MARVTLIAMVVVLVGLLIWALSGPVRPRASAPDSPFGRLGGPGLTGAVAPRTSWAGRASDVPAGGPTIVRAAEPETYTALPGDGPISEAGPGDVTHPNPASRVNYVTTPPPEVPGAQAPAQAEPPAPQPPPEMAPPPPPPPPASESSAPEKTLDRAIEGDVPGQMR